MFCTKCGAGISDDAQFCSHCGQRVPAEEATRDIPMVEAGPPPTAGDAPVSGAGPAVVAVPSSSAPPPPPPPPTRRLFAAPIFKRWWFWVAAGLIVFLVGGFAISALAELLEQDDYTGSPVSSEEPAGSVTDPGYPPADPQGDSAVEPATPVSPQTDDTQQGEIWEWALGKDIWNDPALQRYNRADDNSPMEAHVQSQGFGLMYDSSGTVVSVLLVNDETAIGLPVSSSSYSAYKGRLPGGLDWSMTGKDLGLVNGQQGLESGFGVTPYKYLLETSDGYLLTVELTAYYADDLPGARIHDILVRRR